jgi:uncharacterized Zn-binding protein involved in type VI secretion
MGQPAAKQGDQVTGNDIHIVVTAGGPVPVPFPFTGVITGGLSTDVEICGMAAAVAGSTADNLPPHLPPPGGAFQRPPANKGTIQQGSPTVLINGKPAARSGDPVMTCNDPADLPAGTVVAVGTVLIG